MILGDEHRQALGLGLSGPHRTGKTTLAAQIAQVNACPFVTSSASQVAKDMGIKVDAGLDFETRLAFQERVLEVFTADYEAHAGTGLFISDRTPLDLAAYLLADWLPQRSNPLLDAQAEDYVRRCMEVTGRYFFTVAVVQPGIKYVVEEGKPFPSTLYQEKLNTLILGLATDRRVEAHLCVLPRRIIDLGERAQYLTGYYSDRISQYQGFLSDNLPLN